MRDEEVGELQVTDPSPKKESDTSPRELVVRMTDTPLADVVRDRLEQAIAEGDVGGSLSFNWHLEDGRIEISFESAALDTKPLDESGELMEPGEMPAFLLVEDHELSARALARWLRAYGSVVTATTLAEAREHYAEKTHWLGLLLDVNLPDGSGLDFLEEVRQHDPRVPVLVLTGELDPTRTNRAQSLNAEFAFKPFNDSNLRSFAMRARARQHATDPSVAAVISSLVEEHKLTQREADVLVVVVQSDGSPRAAAAAALGFSPNTAKVHIGSILKKTGYARLADLARRILRDAWVASRPKTPL